MNSQHHHTGEGVSWIVGDIHGCYHLLQPLLEEISRRDGNEVIFVGDYIDRGPRSREVLDCLLQYSRNCVFLLGNHEQLLLDYLLADDAIEATSKLALWIRNGGHVTMESFGARSASEFTGKFSKNYIDFLLQMKLYHRVTAVNGRGYLVTHAGINPHVPLHKQLETDSYAALTASIKNGQRPEDFTPWVRQVFLDADLLPVTSNIVIHGHTPTHVLKDYMSSYDTGPLKEIFKNVPPVELPTLPYFRFSPGDGRLQSIDIDTGSSHTGRITAIGIHSQHEGSFTILQAQDRAGRTPELVEWNVKVGKEM